MCCYAGRRLCVPRVCVCVGVIQRWIWLTCWLSQCWHWVDFFRNNIDSNQYVLRAVSFWTNRRKKSHEKNSFLFKRNNRNGKSARVDLLEQYHLSVNVNVSERIHTVPDELYIHHQIWWDFQHIRNRDSLSLAVCVSLPLSVGFYHHGQYTRRCEPIDQKGCNAIAPIPTAKAICGRILCEFLYMIW